MVNKKLPLSTCKEPHHICFNHPDIQTQWYCYSSMWQANDKLMVWSSTIRGMLWSSQKDVRNSYFEVENKTAKADRDLKARPDHSVDSG